MRKSLPVDNDNQSNSPVQPDHYLTVNYHHHSGDQSLEISDHTQTDLLIGLLASECILLKKRCWSHSPRTGISAMDSLSHLE